MTLHPIIDQDLNRIVQALGKQARSFSGSTVLISGGAGFLGSYLVATLQRLNRDVLDRPCRVIVLDNYITGSREHPIYDADDQHLSFIEHDVMYPVELEGPVDYIMHVAGIASPVYYRQFQVETIEAAVWGTKNLLELANAKKVKSFLFFSSSEIYGDPEPSCVPTPEAYRGNVSCTGPRSCYDESKRLGETLCMAYYRTSQTPVKIVRPFNVYGPGMKPFDYRVIPTFLTQALYSKPLQVHASGRQTRTFCYITDAIAPFFKVLLSSKNGEVYNVGRDQEEVPMLTLANMVVELFEGETNGSKVRAELVQYPDSYPSDEPQRRMPDLTKLKDELGYHPQVDLRTGLHRTLKWFKSTHCREAVSTEAPSLITRS